MRIATVSLLAIMGSAIAGAAPLNDLYFGLDNMRGFQEVYWWFLADGRVLHGMPASGLTQADFDRTCNSAPSMCGNYTLNGSQLSMKFHNGETLNWSYKPLQGGIQLNYLILTPVKKFASGTRLNGTWSPAPISQKFTTGSSETRITVPSFLTFRSDGTFTRRVISDVDNQPRGGGQSTYATGQSQTAGTYALKDYVLTLTTNGRAEQHSIFPVAGDNLNIDGRVYTKQH